MQALALWAVICNRKHIYRCFSNLVDYDHNPQQALDMPRFCLNITGVRASDLKILAEKSISEKGFSFDEMAALRRKGHHVSISGRQRGVFGGGQIILRDPMTGVLTAGSDPRKDGCAMGW